MSSKSRVSSVRFLHYTTLCLLTNPTQKDNTSNGPDICQSNQTLAISQKMGHFYSDSGDGTPDINQTLQKHGYKSLPGTVEMQPKAGWTSDLRGCSSRHRAVTVRSILSSIYCFAVHAFGCFQSWQRHLRIWGRLDCALSTSFRLYFIALRNHASFFRFSSSMIPCERWIMNFFVKASRPLSPNSLLIETLLWVTVWTKVADLFWKGP